MAKNLLIQCVNKGQKEGCYTLNDASLLCKVVQFVGTSLQNAASQPPPSQQETVQETIQETVQDTSDDLSDLSDPIPLKPKEV